MEWCEYQVSGSPEVANTLSSLVIVLVALLTPGQVRFRTILFCIGVGSTWFHFDHNGPLGIHLDQLSIAVGAMDVLIHYTHVPFLAAVTIGTLGIMYTLIFSQTACFMLLGELAVILFMEKITLNHLTKTYLILSVICWVLDLVICSQFFPMFHALWHVGVAMSAYYALKYDLH